MSSTPMHNKFRPQNINKPNAIRFRRLVGKSQSYHWQTRVQWYPAGWKTNHVGIGTRFRHLHYLACHAPKTVQKRWTKIYQNFYLEHFGNSNVASVRYLNKWTCHAWL